jgi:hypothetical protein
MPNQGKTAMHRSSNSQAGWAVVTEGVCDARVQVHRLRHLLNRLVELSKDPRYSELLNRLLGDIVRAGPERIDKIETILDSTSYALALMGEEHLKGRMSLENLTKIEEAVEGVKPFGAPRERMSSQRLARWYLRRTTVRQERRG